MKPIPIWGSSGAEGSAHRPRVRVSTHQSLSQKADSVSAGSFCSTVQSTKTPVPFLRGRIQGLHLEKLRTVRSIGLRVLQSCGGSL